MGNILLAVQAILAFILTFLILMQLRGSGITGGRSGSVSFSRRGLDKLIFKLTFVTSAVFLLISLFSVIY